MPTSLQGRAKQAAHHTSYRFRHLCGMRTVASVRRGWPRRHKRAAAGGDRLRARASGARRPDHVSALVERVQTRGYRAQVVRRPSIPQGNGARRRLGIPATEETLRQPAVARILAALSAPDLRPSRYG